MPLASPIECLGYTPAFRQPGAPRPGRLPGKSLVLTDSRGLTSLRGNLAGDLPARPGRRGLGCYQVELVAFGVGEGGPPDLRPLQAPDVAAEITLG